MEGLAAGHGRLGLAAVENEADRHAHRREGPRLIRSLDGAPRRAVALDLHPLWLHGVEAVLTRLGFRAACFTDPAEALVGVERWQPELFVTDVDLGPGQDGLAVFRKARAVCPDVRGVVFSARESSAAVNRAIAVGFGAYVLKTADADDLALAIRQTFEPSVYLATFGTAFAPGEAAGGPVPVLTARETEILRLVAEGHSNRQVARLLWVSEPTVKFHLKNVYRKLDASNRTEAARRAQLYGLLADASGVREAG